MLVQQALCPLSHLLSPYHYIFLKLLPNMHALQSTYPPGGGASTFFMKGADTTFSARLEQCVASEAPTVHRGYCSSEGMHVGDEHVQTKPGWEGKARLL